MPDRPLRTTEVAERLGVSVRTLENWRRTRTGPPWVELSRTLVAYPEHSLQAWVDRQTRPMPISPAAGQLLRDLEALFVEG